MAERYRRWADRATAPRPVNDVAKYLLDLLRSGPGQIMLSPSVPKG